MKKLTMPGPSGPAKPWRLGLNLDKDEIGWAAIALQPPPIIATEGEIFGDPIRAAVELWLSYPQDLRPVVELYRFNSEEDFVGSRAEMEGMTLDEYRLHLAKAAAALRAVGASIVFLDAKA